MMRARWIASFALFVSVAALSRGERRRADACGCCMPTIGEMTFFDPAVLDVAAYNGLYYDPFTAGFGGYVANYSTDELVGEWHAYLPDVTADDWKKVLFDASPAELTAIHDKLAGKSKTIPKGYDKSSLWAKPSDRLTSAVAFVQIARAIEPSAIFIDPFDTTTKRPLPTGKLLADVTAGIKAAASDPFLAQRYAFQALRIYFYQRDFAGLITFFDKYQGVLAGPTAAMQYRARYYLAGALAHENQLPRAVLELARVDATYAARAGAAAGDFRPKSDTEWREALKLAKTPREKAELWRLVGVRFDGITALQEMVKLDPKSDLIPLLVVREVSKVESFTGRSFGSPDPKEQEATRRSATSLAQLVASLAKTQGVDRPWLYSLIEGHMAAEHGDLNTARVRLQDALAQRPSDPRVAAQVKASLSLALVNTWRIDDTHESELARAMLSIGDKFNLTRSVTQEVRGRLAQLYLQGNRIVDAEFLKEGTVDGDRDAHFAHPSKHWADTKFVKDMLARFDKHDTDFDKFVLAQESFDKAHLQQEVALRYVLDGDFIAAKNAINAPGALSERLDADPFKFHIKDCRECDEKPGTTLATASVISKLAELGKIAAGNDEAAAEASLQIGHVLYNITWSGNSRMVLWHSHQDSFDARPALRWYTRAYDLAKTKETRAKAAYYAAKAERENLSDVDNQVQTEANVPFDPTPRTWFAKLKALSDTKYYKEVLKECSTFATYAGAAP